MSKIKFASENYVNVKTLLDWDASSEESGYIKNRTHYIENNYIKYDYFTYSDERQVDLPAEPGWFTGWDFWCCLVDSIPLDFDNIIGSKMTINNATNDGIDNFAGTVTISEDNILDLRDTDNLVVIKYDYNGKPYERVLIVYEDTTYKSLNLTKGIWICCNQVSKDYTTYGVQQRRDAHLCREFYALNKIYHTLDEKFIPTSVMDRLSQLETSLGTALTEVANLVGGDA